MHEFGSTDNLNKDNRYSPTFSIEELVTKVKNVNYGTHRFLCELVRQRKADQNYKYEEYKKHTDMLEKSAEPRFLLKGQS